MYSIVRCLSFLLQQSTSMPVIVDTVDIYQDKPYSFGTCMNDKHPTSMQLYFSFRHPAYLPKQFNIILIHVWVLILQIHGAFILHIKSKSIQILVLGFVLISSYKIIFECFM